MSCLSWRRCAYTSSSKTPCISTRLLKHVKYSCARLHRVLFDVDVVMHCLLTREPDNLWTRQVYIYMIQGPEAIPLGLREEAPTLLPRTERAVTLADRVFWSPWSVHEYAYNSCLNAPSGGPSCLLLELPSFISLLSPGCTVADRLQLRLVRPLTRTCQLVALALYPHPDWSVSTHVSFFHAMTCFGAP